MKKRSDSSILSTIRISNVLRIVFGLGIMFLVGMLLMEIHSQTYVWQSTVLSDILFPSSRTKCMFNGKDLNDHSHLSNAPGLDKKWKIALLMVYDNQEGTWDPRLMARIVENRRKYCKLHGYDLIDGSKDIDKNRPTAWSKLKATLKYLPHYDYIFYVDMDVVILDIDRPVSIYINSTKDFVMTGDWNGPNTGVWLARNSNWTQWFISTAWDQKQFVQKKSPQGIPYPFEYEQRAFHYMLNTKVWRDRGLPTLDRKDIPAQFLPTPETSLLDHFEFLPQCAFNSYSIHPLNFRASRDVSQYQPGDFLIHFAGKKGQIKVDLIEHFLEASVIHQQHRLLK